MIERRYTFILQYRGVEDEAFEGEFEDGLSNVLETVGLIEGAPEFDLRLLKGAIREVSPADQPETET